MRSKIRTRDALGAICGAMKKVKKLGYAVPPLADGWGVSRYGAGRAAEIHAQMASPAPHHLSVHLQVVHRDTQSDPFLRQGQRQGSISQLDASAHGGEIKDNAFAPILALVAPDEGGLAVLRPSRRQTVVPLAAKLGSRHPRKKDKPFQLVDKIHGLWLPARRHHPRLQFA
jgi:hypothetical protein